MGDSAYSIKFGDRTAIAKQDGTDILNVFPEEEPGGYFTLLIDVLFYLLWNYDEFPPLVLPPVIFVTVQKHR